MLEFSGMGVNLFTEQQLEAIHLATLEVMEHTGLRVFGDEALEILTGAGCRLDKATNMVKFPQYLVEDAIRSAPRKILLAGRDPKNDVTLEAGKVKFTNFGTGIMMEDPETGKLHESTREDLGKTALICDAVDEIDVYTVAVSARDVADNVRELVEAETVFTNTSKHFAHDPADGLCARRLVEMAGAIVGGKENLRERPVMSTCTCPNSPLELHTINTEIIIESAKAGIPVNILSMAMSGGTAPVTLAGCIVVMNAEVLGGIVLSQLTSKGAPLIYGSSTTMLDLLYTTSPVGSPEHGMYGAAIAQLGQYYQIPTYVGGT